ADALKMALEAKEVPANVYVAMRYWYPFTEEAVQQPL
nr:ferrochelatase-2, chloroplastic [Tanacetum cinerariifolium]